MSIFEFLGINSIWWGIPLFAIGFWAGSNIGVIVGVIVGNIIWSLFHRHDKCKDVKDLLNYPYSTCEDTPFNNYIKQTIELEVLKNDLRIHLLAKELGYEWQNKNTEGWVKVKK